MAAGSTAIRRSAERKVGLSLTGLGVQGSSPDQEARLDDQTGASFALESRYAPCLEQGEHARSKGDADWSRRRPRRNLQGDERGGEDD